MLTKDVLLGFSASMLASGFDVASKHPQFHEDLWELCCSKDAFVAAAAPRGHAKTTAVSFIYTMASFLFREHDYVVIVSDTEAQASMFLVNIKNELENNKDIQQLFDLKLDKNGELHYDKDTTTDFECRFNDGTPFKVMAKGAEQKLRGMLWNKKRPNLVVIDDLENDELVMNKDRRAKLRNWVYSALIPSISPLGKVRIVGTVLHSDSFLESLMPPPYAETTQTAGLKMWSTDSRAMWKAVKWKAHNGDMSKLLWPERFTKEYFTQRRNEFMRQGIPDKYSQEYLNEPIDDTVAYFKKKDFKPEEGNPNSLKYYITADLAISEKETADYSVFVVGAVDEKKMLRIKQVIKERMDAREIVDTLFTLNSIYRPEIIGIEDMQITKAIGPFLNEEMHKRGTFFNLIKIPHGNKDKIARARSIQARMRAGGVMFNINGDWFEDFMDELIKFPRARNDDQVDAFAYQGVLLEMMNEAPTKEEQDEEAYLDELEESGYLYDGRSATTGY